MFTTSMDLVLAPDDRRTLEQMLRQTTLSQAIAKRVRVVLAVADGDRYSTIAERFACTDRFIAIWKRRFIEGGGSWRWPMRPARGGAIASVRAWRRRLCG
jgi:hypothetical protein